MLVNVHNTIVLGFESQSWLGNQCGKHISNTHTHLNAQPSNWQELGVFVCFYVMFLWSLEQHGHYKRKSCISAQPESLHGDCDTGWVPVLLLTKEKRGRTALPPFHPCFFLTPLAARDLQGRLGIGCFYKMNMTQKSIYLYTWKSPQLDFSS